MVTGHNVNVYLPCAFSWLHEHFHVVVLVINLKMCSVLIILPSHDHCHMLSVGRTFTENIIENSYIEIERYIYLYRM